MFVVRFIMNDGSCDQEYWYHDFKDAAYHYHLFDDDDSALYFAIEIQGDDGTLIRRIVGFHEDELRIVTSAKKIDLTDLCIYLRALSDNAPNESIKEKLICLRLKVENWPYESYDRFMKMISDHVLVSSISMQNCFRVV